MGKLAFAAAAVLSVGAIFGADGIKDAMPFKFGVAIPARIFMRAPNDSSRLVERHFNSITPKNEMKLHPSPWRDGIGEDFIELAFRFAHEADPDAELYYNDFNMFTAGKRRGVVEMVRKFKEKGVRIDAVGLQSHAGLKGPKVEEYEATIEALASVGVKAMITELDVSALPSAWGLTAEITSRHDYDEKYNPWKDGVLPKDVEKEHARRYIDLFKMYLRHADVIDRVTLWGLTDGDSWLNDFPVRGRTDYPLFFGRDGQMKLCAKAVWRLSQQTAEKKSKNGK